MSTGTTNSERNIRSFFEAIVSPILYDDNSPYKLMTQKLNDIDIDYFEGTLPLGQMVDKEIEIEIKHRILNDFTAYGNELLASRTKSIEEEVIINIRKIVAKYDDREEALHDLKETFKYIQNFVRNQLDFVPIPIYSDAELNELHVAAKRLTLFEKVMDRNDKDVINYYHALIENCVWTCRKLLRHQSSKYLSNLVEIISHEFQA